MDLRFSITPKSVKTNDCTSLNTKVEPTITSGIATPKKAVCTKITAEEDQNQYVRMASEISNNDLDFLALLDAENGFWTIDRKSRKVGKNGYYDYGFCQINKGYHSEIVNDKRFFTDAHWQLEQCYNLYKGGTTFYAKKNINITKPNFSCGS